MSLFWKKSLAFLILFWAWNNVQAAPIKFCTSDWPVWQLGRAMHQMGKFKDVDMTFELYEKCIDGFASNKYDATFITLYDFIGIQRGNQDSVIIGPTDYSSGGDVVVTRSDIAKASDLANKTIALQTDSISLFVLHLYLQANSMTLNDVKIKNVSGETVSKAFQDKAVSAVVGWNPNLDDALKNGGKKVATSADFKESIFDVVVAKKSALNTNKATLQAFMKTWYELVMDQKVAEEAAKIMGVKQDEFTAMLEDAFIYKDAGAATNASRRMQSLVAEIHKFFMVRPTSIGAKDGAVFGAKDLKLGELFSK